MAVSAPIIIAATGVAVAAGTATYGAVQSNKASNQAQANANNQAAQEQQLQAQATQQQQNQESQQTAQNTEQAALSAQKQKAAAAQGAGSTILTSPLGIQSNAGTGQGQKTLLGM